MSQLRDLTDKFTRWKIGKANAELELWDVVDDVLTCCNVEELTPDEEILDAYTLSDGTLRVRTTLNKVGPAEYEVYDIPRDIMDAPDARAAARQWFTNNDPNLTSFGRNARKAQLEKQIADLQAQLRSLP